MRCMAMPSRSTVPPLLSVGGHVDCDTLTPCLGPSPQAPSPQQHPSCGQHLHDLQPVSAYTKARLDGAPSNLV